VDELHRKCNMDRLKITRRSASLCQLEGGEAVSSHLFFFLRDASTQCAVYKRIVHVEVYTFPCLK